MVFDRSTSPLITEDTSYYANVYNDIAGGPKVDVASTDVKRDMGQMPPAPKVGGDKTATDPAQEKPKEEQPKPGDGSVADDPFNPRFNQVEKTETKPDAVPAAQDLPFKGLARPFNENGQSGNLYVDERSGLVLGIEYKGGSRAGQRYVFKRDESGNLTKMHMKVPGQTEASAQRFNLEKTAQGWIFKPPADAGQSLPQFKYLQSNHGVISGDFKVNNKGDIIYEQGDKQGKEILRVDGSRDKYNTREYSRVRELVDGSTSTEYWDGYNWRPGQQTKLSEGVYQTVFQPPANGQRAPVRVVRDANTDGFHADFGTNQIQYKVESWNQGKMTRSRGTTTDTIYNTSVRGKNGHLEWLKGNEKVENGKRVVQFIGDAHEAKRIQAGELPASVVINPANGGEILATYTNGNRILSDSRGNEKQVAYKNGQTVDVLREPTGSITGFRKSDGTVFTRGLEHSQGKRDTHSAWTIQQTGKPAVQFTGRAQFGYGGAFEIAGANNDGYHVDTEGTFKSGRLSQRPLETSVNPGDIQPKPTLPDRETASEKAAATSDQSKAEDRATDKPAELPTDEQLQELAERHRINQKVLLAARARAASLKLTERFTLDNLDKLLTVAAKYRLNSGFDQGAALTHFSSPGAIVGRMIPELLADPDSALPKARQEMKDSLGKSMRDGGAPPHVVERSLQSVDTRFSGLSSRLQPFMTELKNVLPAKN